MLGDLWPHQVEAVSAVLNAIGRGGRTSVIAACGTGKTRISAAVAARLGRGLRVLVVEPTIELLVQTLDAYRTVAGLGNAVAVCSDPSIAEAQLLEGEPGVVVTTTADVLADSTRGAGRLTVLSTYASLPVIAAAHAHHGLPPWDLVVVDEAHRTTGRADGPWKIVHHHAQLPSARRLYMTATPRVATTSGDAVVSMDDTTVFGPVAYRLPFSRAIAMRLLADYRVIVPVVTDEEIRKLTADKSLALRLGAASVQPATVAGQIAVPRTMSEYGVRRAISYHHRVADARTWASTLPATAALMPGGPAGVWASYVSGAQAPHLRRRILDRLSDPGDELVVVSNARVLTEGVDVPAVDAVVFSRPRRSAIETIQAVGRALRAGGRRDKIATIVIPLLLAAGESPEAALESSEWEPVWQVLRALRDHDDRLDEQLRLYRVGLGEGRLFDTLTRERALPPWLTVAGIDVPDAFAAAITIRAVRATTPSWDEFYGAARAYHQVHGNADIPSDWITTEGLRLGDWWRRQRVAYNAGDLTEDRIELLEKLGIVWDQLEETWLLTYEEVKQLSAQGHFVFDEDVVTPHGVVVTNWCSAQRTRRRAGKLSQKRIDLLDAIGFPWDAAQDRWMRRYQELKRVYDQRGSLRRMPSTSREAIWLEGQHAAHRNGRLAPWQIELLGQLAIHFQDRRDAVWRTAYEALAAFHAEEGHWAVPADLVTVDGVNVRSWSKSQRGSRHRETLPPERVTLLDKIGFPWDPLQERWDARCVELERFFAAHGHINIPKSGPLYSWLYQQRKKHRQGQLTEAAQRRLAAIDPLWHDAQASCQSERTRTYFRLTDASWATVKEILPDRGGQVWQNVDHREAIEAILWKLGTGARWEDMSVTNASFVTVTGWYYEWQKNGEWQTISRRAQIRGHHRVPTTATQPAEQTGQRPQSGMV